MKIDWEKWSRTAGWTIADDLVTVDLADGRRHKVRVKEQPDILELTAIVVRGNRVAAIGDLAHRIWTRNRKVQRVGFRIDRHGRLVGDSWLPRPGLTADEFRGTMKHIAAECDRMESLLAGVDVE